MNYIDIYALSHILEIAKHRPPDEIIERDNSPYLKRWYIVRDYGNHNVYLHQFLRNDYDCALHNHPWPSVSFILDGEYVEIMEDGEYLRKTGDVVFRDACTPHRICLIDNKPAYSLFITGPKTNEWGFFCKEGFKHWKDFDKDGGCNE